MGRFTNDGEMMRQRVVLTAFALAILLTGVAIGMVVWSEVSKPGAQDRPRPGERVYTVGEPAVNDPADWSAWEKAPLIKRK
jgi:hypothetical protein